MNHFYWSADALNPRRGRGLTGDVQVHSVLRLQRGIVGPPVRVRRPVGACVCRWGCLCSPLVASSCHGNHHVRGCLYCAAHVSVLCVCACFSLTRGMNMCHYLFLTCRWWCICKEILKLTFRNSKTIRVMIICLVRLINISNILIMFLISKKYPPPLVHLLFCYLSGQPLKIVWKITLIPNAHRWRASWSQASVAPSVISAFSPCCLLSMLGILQQLRVGSVMKHNEIFLTQSCVQVLKPTT